MIEKELTIINRLGLHARAAAQFVRCAGNYQSRIQLQRLDNSAIADAKSILSVLMLAAAQGTNLKLIAIGKDEEQAVSALEDLVANRFWRGKLKNGGRKDEN